MSDKFKFSEQERKELLGYLEWRDADILDRIESIIQDRGNSIQDGWIDVEDRLPEKLALGQYETILICHYGNVRVGSWFANDFYNHSLNGCGQLEGVTHWQPLPSSPKQPKK